MVTLAWKLPRSLEIKIFRYLALVLVALALTVAFIGMWIGLILVRTTTGSLIYGVVAISANLIGLGTLIFSLGLVIYAFSLELRIKELEEKKAC